MNEFNFENLELEWLKIKKMSVKYSTYLKYENVITTQISPYFKEYRLEDFNDTAIFDFFDTKRNELSDSYLKIIKYVLSSIIQFGNETFDFPVIHIERIKFIKKRKVNKVLSEDEKLRDMYYKRDLNRMVIEADKQDARVEGKLEDKAEFIQARYGVSEENWLKSLNERQLESINHIIFKEEDYEKFKLEVEKIK